jgi:hypothetical protein
MNESSRHQGGCFCGAVQFTLQGEPAAMAYCHCDSCRHWSAGPVSAFTLWAPEALQITRGEDCIAGFEGNPKSGDPAVVSRRKWCTRCGGHLFTEHPAMGMLDIPAAVIQDFAFAPAFHVHYQESVHPMADGLPKFSDLPAEAGGSGRQQAE